MIAELKHIKTRLLYCSEIDLSIVVTVVIYTPFLYSRLSNHTALAVFCDTDDLCLCRKLVVLVKLDYGNLLLSRSVTYL